MGRPRLLLLDEPTNGLDPSGIQEMRELIRSLPSRYGMTVSYTHLDVYKRQRSSCGCTTSIRICCFCWSMWTTL